MPKLSYSNLKKMPDLRKQVIKFTLIGIGAVLADMCCYYTFLNILPEKIFYIINNEILAKTLSFLCGMLVTYNFNKFWTWKKKDRSGKRFIKFAVLYGSSLVMNVAINSFVLYLLHSTKAFEAIPFKYMVAFVSATVASALLNFSGQKLWVFRN